jgi:hydrophobic/amphiphilic exporter-1 (mainly G- bacteria), HAE1 family
VRNAQGQAVPLTALAKIETRSGPEFTMRYNEYRAAQINGSAAPGYAELVSVVQLYQALGGGWQ